MQAIFEVMNGALAGKQGQLIPGQVLQVGRSSRAELSVPYDSALADFHFTLQFIDRTCRIRPRTNALVLLNGKATGFAPLQDGDQVVAGDTRFLFRFTDSAASAPRLSRILAEQPDPVFAILDAARDPEILALVRKHADLCQSLFDEDVDEEYHEKSPFLIALAAGGRLTSLIVDLGWGKSWGVFLSSPQTFTGLREHLRELLLPELEDGKRVYFRYYDPRVLRVYLPTCEGPEAEDFFGPITRFFVEGEQSGKLFQFTSRETGVACAPLTVLRG